MSDVVSSGDGISCPARAATVETILGYIGEHAPDHAEFRALVSKHDYFDAIGGWFFGELSPDALRLLGRLVEEMARDLPGTAARANWNDERKPIFYADVERSRGKLADRISQLS
jgi:hypothetical protein